MDIRVLLIEDDEDDYLLTRDLLSEIEGGHYELSWESTYEGGLEALTGGGYDVCLVDFRLGAYTGLDLLHAAAEAGCNVPIILLTGAGDRETDMAAMKAGAADYMDKSSITAPLLERSIRYSVNQARSRRELIKQKALLEAAKEDAELANRAKSEFLANVSHELRTPLNAIIGFAQMIRDETFGPVGEPHYREYAHDIHDSGTHLLDIINDILDISKVEARKIELRETVVDVAEVAESAIRLVEGRAREAEVTLTHRPGRELPCLRVDEQRLKQMLINLLSNAIKFTPPAGRVELAADYAADGLTIRVADTGIGIAPKDVPKALTPFAQIDGDLSRRFEGTGLGLPLTKALVELHGGAIDIDSTPGTGTRVSLTFPLERVVLDPAQAV